MFCPQCGAKLTGDILACLQCGWKEEDDDGSVLQRITDDEKEKEKEEEDGVLQRITDDEIEDEEDEIFTPPTDLSSTTSSYTENYKIKRISKILLVFIAAGLCLLLFVVIDGIATSIYHNSDAYKKKIEEEKIQTASQQIINGEYSAAESTISDVYTKQAAALKSFINLELSRNGFIEAVKSSDVDDADDALWDFSNEVNAFDEEDYVIYLNDTLNKRYNRFKYACKYAADYSSSDSYYSLSSELYDVQAVMMNRVMINNSSEYGNTFTLSSIQERINTSEMAMSYFKDIGWTELKRVGAFDINDTLVSTYCEATSIDISYDLYDTISTLLDECDYEIDSCTTFIENALERFDMDDDIYSTDPNSNYTSYVGYNLRSIDSYEDISDNCDHILTMIRRDVLYYLLTGTSE